MVKHVQEEQYCLYCDELRLCDVRYSEEKDKEDMFNLWNPKDWYVHLASTSDIIYGHLAELEIRATLRT
jgi:hypothetical protein